MDAQKQSVKCPPWGKPTREKNQRLPKEKLNVDVYKLHILGGHAIRESGVHQEGWERWRTAGTKNEQNSTLAGRRTEGQETADAERVGGRATFRSK